MTARKEGAKRDSGESRPSFLRVNGQGKRCPYENAGAAKQRPYESAGAAITHA